MKKQNARERHDDRDEHTDEVCRRHICNLENAPKDHVADVAHRAHDKEKERPIILNGKKETKAQDHRNTHHALRPRDDEDSLLEVSHEERIDDTEQCPREDCQ